MAISKGTRLGEYVLIERLGVGGFGEVWKASNPDSDDEFVAVKIPTHGEAIDALRKEGRLQKKLRHPNIVETRTANLSHNPPYVVFEYVAGVPLDRKLTEVSGAGKQLPYPRFFKIANEIIRALEHAHGQGVIHGDGKPSNVLVDKNFRGTITDLGMGRILKVVSESLPLSGPKDIDPFHRIQGSPRYRAPEIEKGESHSKASDVYAVEIVLHEMLTGDATPLRFPVKEAPEWLSNAIEKATRTDPEERGPDSTVLLKGFHQE